MLLLTTSITICGHNNLYIANPTLALLDVNPNQTINQNLSISTFYGMKSHSHLSYPWKQIESGVKVIESTGTSLPFRDPLNMPTNAGFKFELVSESQLKPHIRFFVNNNNLSSATVQKPSIATAPSNVRILSNVTRANNTANIIGALNNKGMALFYLGNYTEAVKYFDQALAIQPNNVNALGGKGKALEYLGNYTEAVKYFDQALAIQPNNVFALSGKAYTLGNLGNYTEAVKYFDQALAIQPNNVSALGGKGKALEYLGNYTEALKYFDQALAIQPNNVFALMGKQNALSNLSNHSHS